ncbi:MAG: methylated-DNA--[protein]-cysteine S-methyltransferase [Chloroflexi bacterium]|nr:methylated-DNA--[protein]-cysteine S-methyltransferase [Chloroflexota bacterium]
MQSLTREADQAQVSTSAPVHYFDLQAPFGPLRIVERAGAIIAIDLSPKAVPAGWQATATPLLEEAAAQLQAYCARQRRDFSLPLAPEGTSFQTSVWRAMQAIPYGQVSTYGAIARQLGNPRASRAVGSAINRNPIPIIIPCHRVVGADGSLVGYAGGLEVKRYLLDLEQGAGA